MIEIISMFKTTEVSILFYITPIDFQTGNHFLGKQFVQRIEKNASIIQNELSKYHTTALNLTKEIEKDYFGWVVYPNEHLNSKGRWFVAEQILQTIKMSDKL